MANKKNKSKKWAIAGGLLLIIILAALGIIFRSRIFADVVGYPSWFSSQLTTDLASNKWNTTQTQPMTTCLSQGSVSPSTLTDFEKNRYGAQAKVYEARTSNPSNTTKYRIVVYQTGFETDSDNPNGVSQVGVAVGNASSTSLTVDNLQAIYSYYWVPSDNPSSISSSKQFITYKHNSIYSGLFGFNNLSNGTYIPLTIKQGEYSEVGPLPTDFGVNPIYSKITFYDKKSNNTEENFCIPEPLNTQTIKTFTAQKTYADWLEPEVVQKALGTWNQQQTQWLDYCEANFHHVVKQQPTQSELSTFGSNVRVFDVAGEHYFDPNWGVLNDSFYRIKYRLAIVPTKVQVQSNGSRVVQYKVGIGNPNQVPITLKGSSSIRISFMGIPASDVNAIRSSGLFDLKFASGATLQPGAYIQSSTNEFTVGSDAIYSYFDFGTEMRLGDGASPVACVPEPFSLKSLEAIAGVSPTPTPSATSTLTQTATATVAPPTITPTQASSTTTETSYSFNRGFTVFGGTTTVDSSRFGTNSLYLYKFDGASNSWIYTPGMATFSTELGKGYYVYSSTAKSVSLPYATQVTSGYTLTKGWNLLYNIGNKTLDTLKLTYGNASNKSARELIASGTIHSKVFIINNDQATQSCNYFQLLGSTNSTVDCASSTLGSTSTLPSGKAFWVYVY